MKKRQIAFRLYCQFVEKIYKKTDCINDIDSAMSTITDFLLQVHRDIGLQGVGSNFLYDYLVYQFDYWIDKNVTFGDKTSINRIYSVESWKRYLSRFENFSWYNARCRMSAYNISTAILDQFIIHIPIDNCAINQAEEREKQRFHQQEKGLAHCIDSTTLYNHKSVLCMRCPFKNTCKSLLKETYFAIYMDRGYGI